MGNQSGISGSLPVALVAGSLGDYCHVSLQSTYEKFNTTTVASVLTGGFTVGDADPAVADRVKLWLKVTVLGVPVGWYYFSTATNLWATLPLPGDATGLAVGMIAAFPSATVPVGWFECDGAAKSRTDYLALFGLIGTSYGVGNGSSSFNLPDLRGEFIRGWIHGRDGVSGESSTRAIATLEADALKAHTHSIKGVSTGALTGTGYVTSNGSGESSVQTGSTGDLETRPRNVAMMYCIKH